MWLQKVLYVHKLTSYGRTNLGMAVLHYYLTVLCFHTYFNVEYQKINIKKLITHSTVPCYRRVLVARSDYRGRLPQTAVLPRLVCNPNCHVKRK